MIILLMAMTVMMKTKKIIMMMSNIDGDGDAAMSFYNR